VKDRNPPFVRHKLDRISGLQCSFANMDHGRHTYLLVTTVPASALRKFLELWHSRIEGSSGQTHSKEKLMSAAYDVRDPDKPKRVAIVASNPAISKQTGWPIGFWWSELVHSYWEFAEHGYGVEVYSPDGGKLEGDNWSDPRDESRYSADDILSLGFICSSEHLKLVENSKPIKDLNVDEYDTILFAGGQGPMYTFYEDERVHRLAVDFYENGKITAVICHATCLLLKAKRSDGKLLVEGKTWTGFANSEEQYADNFVGKRIQPFWIEDEARKLTNSNFHVSSRFRPHAVRDGNLVTGQQQYSGAQAARLVIEALGM
jgi:putative intracellular protease/amidase